MSMRDAFRRAGLEPPDGTERREEMTGQPGRNRGRRDRARPPDGGQQEQNIPALPDSYFILDQDRPCLHTAFVSKKFVDPLARNLANANPRLTTGQIRRFFNHCREIERRLKVDGESWPRVAADFEVLSAHAQYASSGQNRKIPVGFRLFIDNNIDRVTSSENPSIAFLEGFVPHFEALVGFGAAHMRDT